MAPSSTSPRPGGAVLPAGEWAPGGEPAPRRGLPGRRGSAPARRGRRCSPLTTGHILEDRFLETAEFRALYEEAYRTLYRHLFAEGTALEVLDGWAQALAGGAGGLIDLATLEGDAARLRSFIVERTASLAGDPVVAG